MTIQDIQNKFVEDFSIFDSWEEKYEYIIELGKTLPKINPELKKDEFLIKGCQSSVWLYPEFKNGKIFFFADSDAIITKGIISILVSTFSGQTPSDILSADMKFLDTIKLREYLSPTRANGLLSMIEQIKLYAITFSKIS